MDQSSFVSRQSSFANRHLSFVTRHSPFVNRHLSIVIRDLPVTVTGDRVRIRPTRFGLLFLGLLLALLLGSINYGNNLGYLLTFLLGSMALVSTGHTAQNLAGLTIQSARTTPTFAGQAALFELGLQGSARGHKGLIADLAGSGSDTSPRDLRARETERISLRVPARCRGLLRPGPLVLACTYPLGLFEARCSLDLGLACLVYPRPSPNWAIPLSAQAGTPEHRFDRSNGADDFQGLRNYIPGDALQRISWRASSRGQGLFTKDFAAPSGSALFLDWNHADAADVEGKLSILCSGVLRAHETREKYGLRLPSQTIDPDCGSAHRQRCLAALALFSPSS
jgi:uncharacterized protein (DUF58 family)